MTRLCTLTVLFVCVVVFAVVRGFLRYAEQACNHFIAFKLLALIRDKVFRALRRLCPAKLEGRDKGNLISVITSDIELLEVFYAHTISPAAIALLFTVVMCSVHRFVSLAAGSHCAGGVSRGWSRHSPCHLQAQRGRWDEVPHQIRGAFRLCAGQPARAFRNPAVWPGQEASGGDERRKPMHLAKDEERMKRTAGRNSAVTNTVVLAFDLVMLFVSRPALPKRRRGL